MKIIELGPPPWPPKTSPSGGPNSQIRIEIIKIAYIYCEDGTPWVLQAKWAAPLPLGLLERPHLPGGSKGSHFAIYTEFNEFQ